VLYDSFSELGRTRTPRKVRAKDTNTTKSWGAEQKNPQFHQ
jgi:hypothetical protein